MKFQTHRAFLLVAMLTCLSTATNGAEPKVIMDVSKAKFLTYAPAPGYPIEARKHGWGGTGFYEVQFRRGTAVGVFVTMSTRHKVLDDAALATLRQWRSWKDITRVMMVPITFKIGDEKESATKQR